MALLDIGFSFPWNAPNVPKVRLALLMAWSTAFVAVRSQDHQYPRHLTRCCATRAWLPMIQAGAWNCGLDADTDNTSHFVGLKSMRSHRRRTVQNQFSFGA